MTYAGFFKRLLAAFIDSFILTIIYLAVIRLPFVNYILFMAFTLYYHLVFETSIMRGTPGKYFMGISLVNKTGDNISLKQSLIRFFASFLSSTLLFFGYFFYFFTEKKQTLHDMFAETYVISGVVVKVSVWETFIEQSKSIYYRFKNNRI